MLFSGLVFQRIWTIICGESMGILILSTSPDMFYIYTMLTSQKNPFVHTPSSILSYLLALSKFWDVSRTFFPLILSLSSDSLIQILPSFAVLPLPSVSVPSSCATYVFPLLVNLNL